MPTLEDIDREQRRAQQDEDAPAREARRAYERWMTRLRLWAAMDRDGVTEPGEQARFIGQRLYPDVSAELLEQLAEAVRQNAAAGRPLVRPVRAGQAVGADLERLLEEHGYPTVSPTPGPRPGAG